MENDVALEQAENLKMRAQLLTLLTNDSQRGQGVHELLAGAGLQFQTYYIMALQQIEERYFSQAILNRVEAVLARRQTRAVTLLLYDLAVIFVPLANDGRRLAGGGCGAILRCVGRAGSSRAHRCQRTGAE